VGVAETNVIVLTRGVTEKDYWKDLWRHREMLMFLAWRDILVRYKQTVVGASWVLIRPLLTMLIFTAVFGRIANLPSHNVPYALLVFTGLLPWMFFSSALTDCSNSLITNSHLLSKVYFPRLVVPASTLLVDFAISCSLLILLMFWYGIAPSWKILFLPLFTGIAALCAFGLGLWASALTVRYRDFRHLVPFLLQLGVYASPVGYATSVIPEKWRVVYYLNPMVGVIDGFRWCVLGDDTIAWEGIAFSAFFCVAAVFIGLWFFRKSESSFADVI
jgi:lipopolysaccharide transport system permease protein